MPKKIDPALRERVVRLVLEHRAEYPSTAKAIAAVACQEGVGAESLRRWVVQADIDAGVRDGQTSEDHAEIRLLEAETRKLREDVAILKAATTSSWGNSTPQPLMMGFIDQMRSEGHADSSIIRDLREQDLKVAARTYRAWLQGDVSTRTVTDALVEDAVREAAWRIELLADDRARPSHRHRGRFTRRRGPRLAHSRAGRGHPGEGDPQHDPRQGRDPRRDLLNRDFTAPRPDHTWVSDFTYVRAWVGWVYVAFILDVFSQRIVARHAQTTKHTDLVMIPLRMALWERDRQGRPTEPGQLIHHSDAGSKCTSVVLTEHLALEGIAPSIGSVGDAYDNALMETINGIYKAECVRTTIFHEGPYKTIADVEYATAGWVDWYSHRRLHGSLGMVSPDEFEADYYAALMPEPLPA